ncbi:MAG: hypothetical protein M3Z32_09010 [Acidobacteriota bacterium]|nr:hypothetical protein [Acidobacteriota bacterium]
MKKIAVVLALVAAIGVGARSAELPRKAPDFSIALPDGRSVKISDYRGKVVALAFILTT